MSSCIERLVAQRHSVRKYRSDPIPRTALDRCLECARLAPSACNSQPWSFVIAESDPLRSELGAAAFSGAYAMNRFALSAPVLVAVVTERSKCLAALAGTFRGVQYNLIDVGIACAFLMLAAEEQGLGTCMLGWFDERAVKRVLGLPSRARVDIMISIGYSAENPPVRKDRKPAPQVWRYAGSAAAE